jgi:hypothetical protein
MAVPSSTAMFFVSRKWVFKQEPPSLGSFLLFKKFTKFTNLCAAVEGDATGWIFLHRIYSPPWKAALPYDFSPGVKHLQSSLAIEKNILIILLRSCPGVREQRPVRKGRPQGARLR